VRVTREPSGGSLSGRVRAHIRSSVVGYVAVFIALSGSAYAIDGPLPGQDQVGSADIIDQEVKTADISNGAVHNEDVDGGAITSNKVADGTLTSADVADHTLTGADLEFGSLGAIHISGGAFRPEDIKAQFSGFSKAYGIPPNAIQSDEISNGTVERVDLADEAQGPAGFEFADGDTGQICNIGCTEGTLTLPPGFYAIFGKIEVAQDDLDEEDLDAFCRLTAQGVVFDEAIARMSHDLGIAFAPLSMQGVRLLLDRGPVRLNCKDNDVGSAFGSHLKIDAIKLGSAMSPGG
jgi:hypothetical protein